MTDAADMTLDEIRDALAPEIAAEAVFDGWTATALANAAKARGIDPDVAGLAFPGGPMDMIDAWIASVDERMKAVFTPEKVAAMKIRERIGSLILFRLETAAPEREALRRAVAIMALPVNAPRTARISWRSADLMWRIAGDVATDLNHYTKRMTLIGVYTSTLAVFLDDDSGDFAETRAFLDRRLADVMRFERFKAKWKRGDGDRFSVTRFLGRLRYPA